MVKRGVCCSILIFVALLTILIYLGFHSNQLNPEVNESKAEKTKKEELATHEIRIVAVKEKIIKPENKQKKPQMKPVRVFKPVIKKAENVAALDHKKLQINEKTIESGRKIVAEKGKIPLVQTSDDQIGFHAYLEKMKNMGGRLFIGDADEQAIIAEARVSERDGEFKIDGIHTSALGQIDISGLAFFRPREIIHEALADDIIDKGKAIFGNKDLRCVLMLPMDVEAGILGGLKSYLADKGFSIDMFDIVWGCYMEAHSEIYLNINRGRVRGSQEIISLNLDLTM